MYTMLVQTDEQIDQNLCGSLSHLIIYQIKLQKDEKKVYTGKSLIHLLLDTFLNEHLNFCPSLSCSVLTNLSNILHVGSNL